MITALRIAALILVIVYFNACSITTPGIWHPPPVSHRYHFSVIDSKNTPIEGATITSTLYDHNEKRIVTNLSTKEDGTITFTIPGTADTADHYQNAYLTKCEYSASRIGYLPEYGSLTISYVLTDLNERGHRGLNEASKTITLFRISDLTSANIEAIADTMEKNAILQWAANLHTTFNSRGIILPHHSVEIVTSNEGRFLHAILNTSNVVNSDILDSIGVIRTYFELAGREAFELLRGEAARIHAIDGISISLTGTKKSFNNPADHSLPVECRYLVEKNVFASTSSLDVNETFLSYARVYYNGNELSLAP